MTAGSGPVRVGFAGLGRMGAPMAVNVGRAGFPLAVWNRDRSKLAAVVDRTAAEACESPRDLAMRVDVVITMLADDRASEAVHVGPHGLFSAEGGARTLIEMGTISPAHVRELAGAAGHRTVIDAPVSGSIDAAAAADLLVMAGCDDITLEPVRPVLSSMSREVICLGRQGSGATMKLAVNMLVHALNQTVAESLVLAEAAGIDPADAYAVIERSAAAAPMLTYRKQHYLDEAGRPVSFALALAGKDLALALELCDELGVAAPQTRVNRAQLEAAERAGFGERDMAAVLAFLRGDPT